jgi:hypothetical protein
MPHALPRYAITAPARSFRVGLVVGGLVFAHGVHAYAQDDDAAEVPGWSVGVLAQAPLGRYGEPVDAAVGLAVERRLARPLWLFARMYGHSHAQTPTGREKRPC